jgi:hypothetical protein
MAETTYLIKEDGTQETRLNGNGKLHREDGPAIVRTDGYRAWYLNGFLHREDGPAIEDSDGTKQWFLNGRLHREDGPAVKMSDGYEAWYLNGRYHRENGPAIIHSDGSVEWYLEGIELVNLSVLIQKITKLLRIKAVHEVVYG